MSKLRFGQSEEIDFLSDQRTDLIRCVRAPVDFEDIPLSSNVASDEMFERAITAVRRNGIALKGSSLSLVID